MTTAGVASTPHAASCLQLPVCVQWFQHKHAALPLPTTDGACAGDPGHVVAHIGDRTKTRTLAVEFKPHTATLRFRKTVTLTGSYRVGVSGKLARFTSRPLRVCAKS